MSEAKVQIHKDATPSEKILQGDLLKGTTQDAEGRMLHLQTPDLLTEMNFPLALGPEASENQAYMRSVMPLLYLVKIDAEPVFTPVSKLELDALIKRLGRGGMGAVYAWYMANVIKPAQDQVAAAARDAAERERLKNS